MKRLRILKAGLLGLALMACALIKPSFAATSDTVDLHVSIAGTKSILVVGTTFYDFGAMDVASSSVAASSFTIQNNSPVFIETFTITGQDAVSSVGGVDWNIAASTGPDQYVLEGQFSTARPSNVNSSWTDDDLEDTSQTCTATVFGNGTAGESGQGVGVNDTRALWFRMKTPSSVSDSSDHRVTVTLGVL